VCVCVCVCVYDAMSEAARRMLLSFGLPTRSSTDLATASCPHQTRMVCVDVTRHLMMPAAFSESVEEAPGAWNVCVPADQVMGV